MSNIRKQLSSKKDQELIRIHSQAQYTAWEADRGHKRDGGVSLKVADEASKGREVATVASAIMKGRIERGDENSHRDLQLSGVKASAKKIDRGWGRWLSDRRRV